MPSYYKAWTDALADGEGWIYSEVDWQTDLVVRQIEVCGEQYRWGRWTGLELEGAICDQPPSSWFSDSPNVEISSAEFESAWNAARQRNPNGW